MATEHHRDAHSQPTLWDAPTLLKRDFRILKLGQGPEASFVVDLSIARETLASGGSLKQANPKALLKASYRFADCRSRDAESLCSISKSF
jgi:hypothetical protein